MSVLSGYLALGTGSGTSFTEQNGSGYARVAVAFNQAVTGSNRHISNAAVATYTATGTWSASTQVAVYAALTGGSPLIWWNKAQATAALASGGSITLAANSVNWFLADAAAAPGLQTLWAVADVIGTTASGENLVVGAPVIVDDGVMSAGFPPNCVAKLVAANLNSTADQPFVLNPTLNGAGFVVRKIVATNASISLTTAAGGIYPAASKGGTALVANTQVYSALTTSALYTSLTLAATTNSVVYTTAPILSLTTAQGAAATGDLYVFADTVF